MEQNLNNDFMLYLSNDKGKKMNTSYPYPCKITGVEDLRKAAMYDHVSARYGDTSTKKAHRSKKTFIEADNVCMDIDNEEKNPMLPDIPPECWETPETVQAAFPNVAFYAIPSRHHMMVKHEGDGRPPRPRYHYYFKLSRTFKSADDWKQIKVDMQKYFPAFDSDALDAARFMYGVSHPQPEFYPGEICIDTFMDQMKKQLEDEESVIPVGTRNPTLSRFALTKLKRYGEDDEQAYNAFLHRAEYCEVPLDDDEISTIWRSAVDGYRKKVLPDPNYIPPREYAARQAAGEFNKSIEGPVTSNTIRAVMDALGVNIRLNLITGQADIDGLPKIYSKENATNTLPVIITDYLKVHNASIGRQALDDCLFLIEDMNRYNPVADMLKSTVWDGDDRIPVVMEILSAPAEGQPLLFMKKWLWQTASMALNDEEQPYGADGILVLQGSQGEGKTRFFDRLSITPEWFHGGAIIDMDKKDTIIQGTGGWITELGELDSTLKKEQSALKAFLTASCDVYRVPYGRTPVRKPRRTSFCATVNPEEFLNDDTGSRRYWTVSIGEIDIDRLNSLPVEWFKQLWAQVYTQYYLKDPQGFRLTREERAALERSNQQYSKPLPGEIEIMDGLDWKQPEKQWDWQKVSSVRDFLTIYSVTPVQIGKALSKIKTRDLRIKQKRPGNVSYYYLPTRRAPSKEKILIDDDPAIPEGVDWPKPMVKDA